jgi:hypothetical protein
MSTTLDILNNLRNSLKDFLDQIIDVLPLSQTADLVMARVLLDTPGVIEAVANYIVNKLLPLKDMVRKRDELFFLENNILFESLDANDKVNHFKNIWENHLDDDNKQVVWKWFEKFLLIGGKYRDSCEPR